MRETAEDYFEKETPEGFTISDDKTAEWALKKIKAAQAEHDRLMDLVTAERDELNEKEVIFRENESTYIPIGAAHRLENPGKLPLAIIEVQNGKYLGEDDIVRLEDVYGRVDAEMKEDA